MMKRVISSTNNDAAAKKYAVIRKCEELFDILDKGDEETDELFARYGLQDLYNELSLALRALKN